MHSKGVGLVIWSKPRALWPQPHFPDAGVTRSLGVSPPVSAALRPALWGDSAQSVSVPASRVTQATHGLPSVLV